jgi:hypothetical protein
MYVCMYLTMECTVIIVHSMVINKMLAATAVSVHCKSRGYLTKLFRIQKSSYLVHLELRWFLASFDRYVVIVMRVEMEVAQGSDVDLPFSTVLFVLFIAPLSRVNDRFIELSTYVLSMSHACAYFRE